MPGISKIATLGELEAEIAASSERDVWFFKHSLTCGVSSAAPSILGASRSTSCAAAWAIRTIS